MHRICIAFFTQLTSGDLAELLFDDTSTFSQRNDSISYNQLLSHHSHSHLNSPAIPGTWHDLAPGLLQPQLTQLLRLPLPFQLPLLNLLHQAPIFSFLQSQLLLFGTQTRQIGQGLHLLDLTPENIWKNARIWRMSALRKMEMEMIEMN